MAKAILLASEGRGFSDEAIELARSIATRNHAAVHVLCIARIWGTQFGLPHPGLKPTRHELAACRDHVAAALRRLKPLEVPPSGEVAASRSASGKIVREAKARNAEVIVMGADRLRSSLWVGLMWSHEPQRVLQSAKIPVYLAFGDAGA